MKKRTSKSASATSETSSLSGTSARMVGTASIRPDGAVPGSIAELAESIADQISGMTPQQFRESLVRTGIVTPSGKLTSKYK